MPTVEHVPKLFRSIFAYMSAPNLLIVSTVCARVGSDGGCMNAKRIGRASGPSTGRT